MKFIILVVFTLSDGSNTVKTALTRDEDFCRTTVDLYNDLGKKARIMQIAPIKDIRAACNVVSDSKDV